MIPPPELLGSDEVSLYKLLSRMASYSGETRSCAYRLFQLIASCEPDAVCTRLIGLIQSSALPDIRVLSAKCVKYTLCHYKCTKFHNWKNDFLQLVHTEGERTVLEQLLNVVIHLASKLLPNNLWPELLFLIFPAILDRTRRVPASALFLFAKLACLMKLSCFPPVEKLQSAIHFHLKNCAAESAEDTRNCGLLAMFTFINHLPMSKKERMGIQCLLSSGLDILEATVRDNQHSTAKNTVKRFTQLIKPEPKFICGVLSQMVQTMIFIAKYSNAREDVKLCALNLVIVLAKTREKEPVMIEHLLVFPYLDHIVAILLEMLSDTKDEHTGKENNLKYARMFSNALSSALGGDLLVPVVTKLLPACLSDPDWKKRHAALFFLKEIAKGCCEAMKENLEQFINMVVDSFQDNHPRVQGVALITLCVLLVDLKPDLEAQHFYTIFPALLQQAIKTSNQLHIQVEAVISTWTIIRFCNKNFLKIHLMDLLDILIHMIILTKSRAVEDEASLILGYVAYLLEDILESDYRVIMDWLIIFLKDAICFFDLKFCAKLVNCICIVGPVLGKGHFRNDAKEVMDLISSNCETLEEDDPATGYLLQAWVKLLKCLGWDFLPYLNLVIPPSLLSVQSDSELIVSSTNIDNNTGVKTDKGNGEKLLDEICQYADELKKDFYPWMGQAVLLVLPFLKIKFHKKVRKAAISAMSKLLRSAKLVGEKEKPCVAVKQLCAEMIASLIEAMQEEDDKELCCEMVKSLVDCIQLQILEEGHVSSPSSF